MTRKRDNRPTVITAVLYLMIFTNSAPISLANPVALQEPCRHLRGQLKMMPCGREVAAKGDDHRQGLGQEWYAVNVTGSVRFASVVRCVDHPGSQLASWDVNVALCSSRLVWRGERCTVSRLHMVADPLTNSRDGKVVEKKWL